MVEVGGHSYIHWPNSKNFVWVIASHERLTSKNLNLSMSMRNYRRSNRGRIEASRYVTLAWDMSNKGAST